MSERRLIRFGLWANVVALLCGSCVVCGAIGLNFAPNATPSPLLVNFIPNKTVSPAASAQPTLAPVLPPTSAPADLPTDLPKPTVPPALATDVQSIPFKYHCDIKRADGLEHRCYEVTVLPVGNPAAECAGAITGGTGTWSEGSCSVADRIGTCTGGLLILSNPPKTYRFYADHGAYDIASATAFCNTLKGQFTVDKE